MSMKVWKELMVSTGEYQDANTGETKKRWVKVGCIFQDDQDPTSMSLSLEVMPLPKLDKQGYPKCSIAMFDPKPRGQQQQQGGHQQYGSQQQQYQTPAPQQQYQQPQFQQGQNGYNQPHN